MRNTASNLEKSSYVSLFSEKKSSGNFIIMDTKIIMIDFFISLPEKVPLWRSKNVYGTRFQNSRYFLMQIHNPRFLEKIFLHIANNQF